jgi:hypothetical protein
MLYDDFNFMRDHLAQMFVDDLSRHDDVQTSLEHSLQHIAKKYKKWILPQFIKIGNSESNLLDIKIFGLERNYNGEYIQENEVKYLLCDLIDIHPYGNNSVDAMCNRITDKFDRYMKSAYIIDPVEDEKSTSDVSAHNCPNCGAFLKKGAHKCEYCQTEFW